MANAAWRPFTLHNVASNNSTLRSLKQSIRFDSFNDMTEQTFQSQVKNPDFTKQQVHSFTSELEETFANPLFLITDSGQFNTKYGADFSLDQVTHSYLFTQQSRQFTYVMEAFANLASLASETSKHKKEEMVFHSVFENIIERYTRTRAKPNPVLVETRSSEFCYRLTIVVEAVPVDAQCALRFNTSNLRLIREFEILYHVWEKFRDDLAHKACTADQMVGIPMPFEFVNVSGNEFDFCLAKTGVHYFDMRGAYVPVKGVRVPSTGQLLESFLSYMSIEKLGPSLGYLGDLLKSQKRWFSLSSALKILDQILCRLMVLHRYGVILGNLDVKFLNFGVREAINVLYVNNFDCAVVAPTQNRPLTCRNERFASTGTLKGTVHFINDIESAFYIFLALLIPRLPWDDKDQSNPRNGSWSVSELNRNLKLHLDERQRLWDGSACLERLLRNYDVDFGDSSPVFDGFAFNIILTVHARIKEAISLCSCMSQQDFMTNTLTVSTASYNAFTNIRKVIVSFFRFETLSNNLRDAACQNKVERLLEAAESKDVRALWDLTDWCWSTYQTTFLTGRRALSRSVKM